MMIKQVVAAAAVAGAAVVGSAGAAQAGEYHKPQVAWVKNVQVHGDTATLDAAYRCYGGNAGTHLWVSLKQGGGIHGPAWKLAQQEGTSALARSWYDAHPGDDGSPGVTCDGRWQGQRFTVHRELANPENPSHPAAWEQLEEGKAFMQFCLFDSTADPTGADLSRGFGYNYANVRVHVAD